MKKQPDDSNFENKPGRWIGNYGQSSSTHGGSADEKRSDDDSFQDQNITDGTQQQSSRTGHIDNSLDD